MAKLGKKLKVDDLSYIATQLYFEIGKPGWFENIDTELGKVLDKASEASWFKLKHKSRLKKMEKDLRDYYNSHKNLLEKE